MANISKKQVAALAEKKKAKGAVAPKPTKMSAPMKALIGVVAPAKAPKAPKGPKGSMGMM